MEPSYIDSRVVRTIRSLRKIQSNNNDSFSTRTSTPSQDLQVLEIISNREEIKHITNSIHPGDLYEMIKTDNTIIRDLLTEPILSQTQVKRIQEKISDHKESVKIQDAKRLMSHKIQEKREAIKKQLAES
jgi:hypothetical protein